MNEFRATIPADAEIRGCLASQRQCDQRFKEDPRVFDGMMPFKQSYFLKQRKSFVFVYPLVAF